MLVFFGPRKSAFNKTSLHKLLTNVTYIGQICYQGTIHEGEQSAIVDPQQFTEVQRLLHLNHRTGGVESRQRHSALLKGLLHCTPSGCRMIHSHTTKNRTKLYRYYVCGNAQKRGWDQCPSKSVPAGEIEQYVIDQIRSIGRDPGLVAATWGEVGQQTEERKAALIAERRKRSVKPYLARVVR